jgi:hypothetical protein
MTGLGRSGIDRFVTPIRFLLQNLGDRTEIRRNIFCAAAGFSETVSKCFDYVIEESQSKISVSTAGRQKCGTAQFSNPEQSGRK